MALDTSIYNRLDQIDMGGSLEKGMKLGQMINGQMKEARVNDAYKAGIVQNSDGSTTFDNKKALSALANVQGAGKDYLDAKDKFDTQDLTKQKAQMENTLQKLNVTGQLLGSAKDQGSWTMALRKAEQLGLSKPGEHPEQFDPGYVQHLTGMTLSTKDKLENEYKARHASVEEGQLGNTQLKTKQDYSIDQSKLGLEKQKIDIERMKANKEANGATEGRKALDKDYAKDYNDWTSTGKAGLDKNLQRLKEAKKMLQEDSSLTGSIRGMLPDAIRNTTNEKAIAVRDQVRAAAQGALKATLGNAFTEKEGERIMNQAYNEKLSPEENIRKIDIAIQELETNRQNNDTKAELFGRTGSIAQLAKQPVKPIPPADDGKTKMIGDQLYRKVEGGWLPAAK